jgi:large subunit ribosomal protein L13
MGTKTTIPREQDVSHEWLMIDAAGVPAGRLASRVADVLRGKDKPTYTPHIDAGAFVVVINAEKVKLTGRKEDQKIYQRYSGYPDGLKRVTARAVRARHPERIIEHAVRGMLPDNHTRRRLMTRLKVYAGAEHPHAAQQPREMKLA